MWPTRVVSFGKKNKSADIVPGSRFLMIYKRTMRLFFLGFVPLYHCCLSMKFELNQWPKFVEFNVKRKKWVHRNIERIYSCLTRTLLSASHITLFKLTPHLPSRWRCITFGESRTRDVSSISITWRLTKSALSRNQFAIGWYRSATRMFHDFALFSRLQPVPA